MDYVIKNSKDVYIRLNSNGQPVTCTKQDKTLFEYSKARNICKTMPKTLKRMNFMVKAVPEISPQINKDIINDLREYLIRSPYELSENISRWVDKFGSCYDVLDEAKQNLKSLLADLEKYDKELLDILHIVEIDTSKDLYNGWKIYKAIKENRKNRRMVKDEILIINNVLERIDPSCLKRDQVQKAVDGLFGRKYRFRIIEEDEINGM